MQKQIWSSNRELDDVTDDLELWAEPPDRLVAYGRLAGVRGLQGPHGADRLLEACGSAVRSVWSLAAVYSTKETNATDTRCVRYQRP